MEREYEGVGEGVMRRGKGENEGVVNSYRKSDGEKEREGGRGREGGREEGREGERERERERERRQGGRSWRGRRNFGDEGACLGPKP